VACLRYITLERCSRCEPLHAYFSQFNGRSGSKIELAQFNAHSPALVMIVPAGQFGGRGGMARRYS